MHSGPSPGHEHAKGLVDSIKAKKPMDELLMLVNKIPTSALDEEDMEYSQGMYCLRRRFRKSEVLENFRKLDVPTVIGEALVCILKCPVYAMCKLLLAKLNKYEFFYL